MENAGSLSIIKSGLLDTIRDKGRVGFRHVGIPVNGVMDSSAYFIANLLVGNVEKEACIEMAFPPAHIRFNNNLFFALAGANFDAHLNNLSIQTGKCYQAKEGDILTFKKQVSGNFIYLSVAGGFLIDDVLASKTTNLKSGFGGWHGRKLMKGDLLEVKLSSIKPNNRIYLDYAHTRPTHSFIRCITGPEFHLLSAQQQNALFDFNFSIDKQSDTMAYRINGDKIFQHEISMASSGVSIGTIQLLPDGNIMALMSDHQTTGGYPRVLQIIQQDIRMLAQYPYQKTFQVKRISLQEAIAVEEEDNLNRSNIARAYLKMVG